MNRSPERAICAITVALTAGLLSGCSAAGTAPSSAAPTIATLQSHAAGTATPTDDLFTRYGAPPRQRLDDSDADQARSMAPLNRCLADHGAAHKPTTDAGASTFNAAQQLCAPLYPKPPLQYDRSNPRALAFVQRVITCLRSRGVKEVAIAPDDGSGRIQLEFGGNGDSRSIALGLQYTSACEQTASR